MYTAVLVICLLNTVGLIFLATWLWLHMGDDHTHEQEEPVRSSPNGAKLDRPIRLARTEEG